MKVLLLGFAKISYMPYMHAYLDAIDDNTVVDLIYWKRDDQEDSPVPAKINDVWCYDGKVSEDVDG